MSGSSLLELQASLLATVTDKDRVSVLDDVNFFR